jgi:putative ATP-dependent endonuclease of the OLD family
MKLKSLILENFRSYKDRTVINFDDFTALIGKNDVGKSTILEALEIFFNSEIVKIDKNDVCVFNQENFDITIGCIFTDLPEKIVLDSSAVTDLKSEYLLNENHDLEILKVYKCNTNSKTISPNIYVRAYHPTNFKNKLIHLKREDLKKIVEQLNIPKEVVNMSSNVSMRQCIYKAVDESEGLNCSVQDIQLNKEDAKAIWTNLQEYLPIYALFQADRPSKDGDHEVQDPMKIAIKQALGSVESELTKIKKEVQNAALSIAKNTLEKLKEMDEKLASELITEFSSEPNWASLFKLTLNSENGIPVNKRGSGVRRLILLNFFRAEAERRKEGTERGIIYAIEEPETAQHPKNQKMLIESLQALSQKNCQIIITSHVPGIAGLLSTSSIRYITSESKKYGVIDRASDSELIEIANELGVLPDNRVKLFLCVEGKNDVAFLQNISKILSANGSIKINLFEDDRIAVLPLGGSTSLKQFIHKHYLKAFRLPEIHIMDKDNNNNISKLQKKLDERQDGSKIIRTKRREMENYIHKDVVTKYFIKKYPCLSKEVFNCINFEDPDCDIPKSINKLLNNYKDRLGKAAPPSEETIKDWLNSKVAAEMTYEHLKDMGVVDELISWFLEIEKLMQNVYEGSVTG